MIKKIRNEDENEMTLTDKFNICLNLEFMNVLNKIKSKKTKT